MSEGHSSSHNSDTEEYDATAVVEIKGDQAATDSAVGLLNLSGIDMWALGVCISVAGIYYAWNVGLEAGFGSYVVARFFVSCAYISLILSISELSSGLPFAGGAYGIARVTLGPFAGYMVACYESMETVVACSALVYSFAKQIVNISEIDVTWEPWIWALFYAVYIALHSWGGRLFWNAAMALAVGNLILAVIFLLGSVRYADFTEYASWPNAPSEHQAWFRGGLYMFVRFVPSCCNGFTCIECVNLACKDVQNPKRDIPRGFVASVLTQAFFCMAAVFVTSSVAPGIVAVSKSGAPLTFGYMKIFDCTAKQAQTINLPSLCASAFGRMFSFGRQISAMGKSGMLPSMLGEELPSRHTPFYALLLGSVLGYGLCLLSYYQPSVQLVQMVQMALLGAYTSYVAQLCSFIMFQGTFSNIKREFISPLGIPGAVYSMFWYLVCFMSISFFQDNHFAITGYAVYTGAILIYYLIVVQHRQFFSEEEKSILFRAHLVKNNVVRAAKLKKGKHSNVAHIGAGYNPAGGAHAVPATAGRGSNYSPKSMNANNSIGVNPSNAGYAGEPRVETDLEMRSVSSHQLAMQYPSAGSSLSLFTAQSETGSTVSATGTAATVQDAPTMRLYTRSDILSSTTAGDDATAHIALTSSTGSNRRIAPLVLPDIDTSTDTTRAALQESSDGDGQSAFQQGTRSRVKSVSPRHAYERIAPETPTATMTVTSTVVDAAHDVQWKVGYDGDL